MADDPTPRRFELDELVVRPGTYFNPQTEVLLTVDDSSEIDSEIFNMEKFEGADWILVADDLAVDDARRDEMLERFQVHYHPGGVTSITDDGDDHGDDHDDVLEADDQEVGRED